MKRGISWQRVGFVASLAGMLQCDSSTRRPDSSSFSNDPIESSWCFPYLPGQCPDESPLPRGDELPLGLTHFPDKPSECPEHLPFEQAETPGICTSSNSECASHEMCDAQGQGLCVPHDDGVGESDIWCLCEYSECRQDGDCNDGESCLCPQHKNQGLSLCVSANCKSDSDCASGLCLLSQSPCGTSDNLGKYCATDEDFCRGNDSCQGLGNGNVWSNCEYNREKDHFGCREYYQPDDSRCRPTGRHD